MKSGFGRKHSLALSALGHGLLTQYQNFFGDQAVLAARTSLSFSNHSAVRSVHIGCGYDAGMFSAIKTGVLDLIGVDINTATGRVSTQCLVDANFFAQLSNDIQEDPVVHALYEQELIVQMVQELDLMMKVVRQLPFGPLKALLVGGDITTQPLGVIIGGQADILIGNMMIHQTRPVEISSVLRHLGTGIRPHGVGVLTVPGHFISYPEGDGRRDWVQKSFYGSLEVKLFEQVLFKNLRQEFGEVEAINFAEVDGLAAEHEELIAGCETMYCQNAFPVYTTVRVPLSHLLLGLGLLAALEATRYELPVVSVAQIVRKSTDELKRTFLLNIAQSYLLCGVLYVYKKVERV